MTNYRNSNPAYRNDIDLLVAIKKELEQYAKDILLAAEQMESAREILRNTATIEEDMYGVSSGMANIKYQLHAASEKFRTKAEFLRKANLDNYVSNIAGYMTEFQVKELKEKYAEDTTH